MNPFIVILGIVVFVRLFNKFMDGYAPFDNPKYACIVVIKCKPKAAEYYSAKIADPVFKEIMQYSIGLK